MLIAGLDTSRVENVGDCQHWCFSDRRLDKGNHLFNVNNVPGVNHPGDVAADARELAVAILVSLNLAHHRVRHRRHGE